MAVYYIHAPDAGMLKIGFAANPISRLSKMQVDSPVLLLLLAVEDGDKAVERSRHKQFADLRRRGEWFAYTDELAAHVAALPAFERPAKVRKAWRVTDIAAATGLSKGHVSQILRGKWSCSWNAALDIERVTGGAIDAGDLVPLIREARIGFRTGAFSSFRAPGPVRSTPDASAHLLTGAA